jgi:hypothetical protein
LGQNTFTQFYFKLYENKTINIEWSRPKNGRQHMVKEVLEWMHQGRQDEDGDRDR